MDGMYDAFFEHNSNHALHNMTMLNAGLTMYLLSILDEMSHSITLVLGAVDMIKPASQLVEALIGYSIVIIAIETVSSITNFHKTYNRTLIYLSCLLLIFFTLFGYSKFLIGLVYRV